MTPSTRPGPVADAGPWPVPLAIRGWHAAFWALLCLAGLLVVTRASMNPRGRIAGAIGIGLLGLAYAVLVHRRVRRRGWRAHLYLVTAIVVTSLTSGIDSSLSLLLCIVYPQIWMFTEGLLTGSLYTVALSAATLTGFLVESGGVTWRTLRDNGPQMAVAMLFSLLMGVWIARIVDQSVERAELIDELQAARTELTEAEHARGVMAERERMAREIHDTLAQGFTSIIMLSQAAAAGMGKDPARAGERLGQIEEVARENLAEARALVAAFAPVGLADSTLPDAVRRLAARFGAQAGIDVDVEIAEAAGALSRDQEVVLLRAVQESLTNVRRHAGARHVTVHLLVGDEGARVEVRDDGVGFDLDAADGSGYGLAGMRGRVEDVGGELDVASSPGGGTRVTVLVPTGRPGAGLEPVVAQRTEEA